MGIIYKFYCDQCKRATPLTTIASYPDGWVKVMHTDHPEVHVCSYQCLLECAQQFYDVTPATMTLKYPLDNPMPFGYGDIAEAPDTPAELMEEMSGGGPPSQRQIVFRDGKLVDLATGEEVRESELHWHG